MIWYGPICAPEVQCESGASSNRPAAASRIGRSSGPPRLSEEIGLRWLIPYRWHRLGRGKHPVHPERAPEPSGTALRFSAIVRDSSPTPDEDHTILHPTVNAPAPCNRAPRIESARMPTSPWVWRTTSPWKATKWKSFATARCDHRFHGADSLIGLRPLIAFGCLYLDNSISVSLYICISMLARDGELASCATNLRRRREIRTCDQARPGEWRRT